MLLCSACAVLRTTCQNDSSLRGRRNVVIQKGEVVMRILSKVLVVCAILLAGCAPDRDAAMNRFISRGTLAQQGVENGDEISYWDGTGSGGEPRIVIDLDQQRAYFYK